MNAKWIQSRRSMLVGLLGATVLFSSPVAAQADQGKWWNPERGAGRSSGRHDTYQPPARRDRGVYRQGPRYSRPWQGRRVYRDRVWVRSGWGYRGRPAYGWRYYGRPYFYYPQHVVYVHPVRFFISVGAVIGGAHVHGSYSDPGDIYGCNFCDAEFSSYDAWDAHVAHCRYAPDGYRVITSDWDQGQWNDDGLRDDHAWEQDEQD